MGLTTIIFYNESTSDRAVHSSCGVDGERELRREFPFERMDAG